MEGLILIAFFLVVAATIFRAAAGEPEADLPREVPHPDGTPRALQGVSVKWVDDGDTAIVSNFSSETTLRLFAIDCPEDSQPWGDTATAGLIKMVARRFVYIETHGVDAYGRTLATIYVQHESKLINVNER